MWKLHNNPYNNISASPQFSLSISISSSKKKIISYVKKQKNVIHNQEKHQSVEIDPEMR